MDAETLEVAWRAYRATRSKVDRGPKETTELGETTEPKETT